MLKLAGSLGHRRPTANRWLVQAKPAHRQIETYAFPVTCPSACVGVRWSGRVTDVDSVGALGLLVCGSVSANEQTLSSGLCRGSVTANEQTSASGLCSFVRIVRRAWGTRLHRPVCSFVRRGEEVAERGATGRPEGGADGVPLIERDPSPSLCPPHWIEHKTVAFSARRGSSLRRRGETRHERIPVVGNDLSNNRVRL